MDWNKSIRCKPAGVLIVVWAEIYLSLFTLEYQTILAKRQQIAELEQQAIYRYTRAINEPQFIEQNTYQTVQSTDRFGRSLSVTYLNTLKTPGNSAEYKANAQKAILQMAQLQLEVGRLYKTLRMRTWAKNTFLQIVREVEENSPTGKAARQELLALK